MWDPTTYLRYGDERGRPFSDLLARVGAVKPAEVVDLGCGPGTLTVGLAQRWPAARVIGLDSSPEMIDAARALDSTVEFDVADVRDWHAGPDIDVVLANAVLQWVPDHCDLLTRWAGELKSGGYLAFQVPGNFTAPSHLAIRAVAQHARWRDRALAGLRDPASVLDPQEYAARLTAGGATVDAWETTYVHLLPVRGDTHPVLAWLEGTALRPVRDSLDDEDWAAFRAQVQDRLVAAYPVRDGIVYFPFRRIFVVARIA